MKHSQKEKSWALSIEDTIETYQTDQTTGLASHEAKQRLTQYGENIFDETEPPQWWHILLQQFTSPLIIILLLAVALTVSLQEWLDAIIIALAVIVNAGLGFYQEYKAERAIAGLRSYILERTRVMRDGREIEVDPRTIVPGDILHLKHGARITADARIISTTNFAADEAILTGESLPVHKHEDILSDATPLADRRNMVFAGTLAVEGSAFATVTKTGSQTEIGKLADLVANTISEPTPLQVAIKKLTWIIIAAIGAVVTFVFSIGISRGESVYEMLILSVAIIVGAVPEALPVGLTAVLAVGVERIARARGIMRSLTAAETLGSTSAIITDKTGTLTEAKMQLVDINPYFGTEEGYDHSDTKDLTSAQATLLRTAVYNTDVLIENPNKDPDIWDLSGHPLEANIVKAAGRYGLVTAEQYSARTRTIIPFNSRHKFSVVELPQAALPPSFTDIKKPLAILGAPDTLLQQAELTSDSYQSYLQSVEQLSNEGKRVLGVAIVDGDTLPEHPAPEDIGRTTFLGTLSFFDPIRPDVPEALRHIETYGVTVYMATGDLKGTALAIGRDLGWSLTESSVLTGEEMQQLSDADLRAALTHVRIFARVTPEDKLRVTKLLQAQGATVAMTGDGVNDAPSLKAANIGIAVGSGSDVAKSVADLVLLDNNFKTIVMSIEEGKRMLRNIKKIFVYLMSNSLDEVILIGGSILAGLAMPLTAAQIIWVNLFTGSIPAISFAFDTNEQSGDKYASRRILDRRVVFMTISIGVIMSGLLFSIYYFLLTASVDVDTARTVLFACFGSYILVIAFSFRNLAAPVWTYSIFENRLLFFGAILGLSLLITTIYVPPLQVLFSTVSLSLWWFGFILLWLMASVAIVEALKAISNHLLAPKSAMID